MSALEVVLVGCSGPKLDRAAPARELYTSALFKKARAYAEAKGCEWGILSALHGLVPPDEVLEPYDFTFEARYGQGPRFRRDDFARWETKASNAIRSKWPGATFVFLAGESYRGAAAGQHYAWSEPRTKFVEPLAGMMIGERLNWLTRETERLLAARASVEPRAVETDGPEVEERDCDFCGEETRVAVSEYGHATPERPEVAAICEGCARWALEVLRGAPAVGERVA